MFGVRSMDPEILDSPLSVHAGRWMVICGTLTYIIGVFWICGQKLSLWGYLWRSFVVVIAWVLVDEWIAVQLGSNASVFVSILLVAAMPWIGAWMSWRHEWGAS